MKNPLRTFTRAALVLVLGTVMPGLPQPADAAAASGEVPADAAAASADAARSREQLEQRLHDARERLEQAAQEMADLSLALNDEVGPEMRHLAHGGSRTVLGINIGILGHDGARDGVRVLSVSPGGPADTAGIKANDVIVSYAGKALAGEDGRSPQRQLLAAIGQTKAGEPVAIEYRRDGKLSKAQIVPKTMEESFGELGGLPWIHDMPSMPNMPEMHDLPMMRDLEDLPADTQVFAFHPHDMHGFGSAELVDLTPRLGQYFGTDKGLLVVRAPRDDRLKLQDGDVIIDIDGRAPSGSAHAFQILNSYRPGETVKLHLMRQQKRIEQAVEIPGPAPRAPG